MFRLSARADPAFLAEMLYEAVNWFDDGAEERPPLDAVLARPENARYVAGWGRPGDVALCALDGRDEPVGAVAGVRDEDRLVGRAMNDCWVAFARSGKPDCADAPQC